jgi:hypothetical protein
MPFLMNPFVVRLPGLVLIDRTTGTNIGNATGGGGLAAAWDGTTSQAYAACAQAPIGTGWLGKTLASPRRFGQAVIRGSNDQGFVTGSNPTVTINVLGKNGAAPTALNDGTNIGTSGLITDTANESAGRTITSTDLVTAWDHIFIAFSAANVIAVAEIDLYAWE